MVDSANGRRGLGYEEAMNVEAGRASADDCPSSCCESGVDSSR